MLSDAELMERIAKGDKASFNELADRLMPKSIRFVVKMTGSAADAEDIVQDVFFKVWIKAGTWKRRADGSVQAWVYKMLYNRTIDLLRRAGRTVRMPEGYDVPDRHEDDEEMLVKQRHDEVLEMVLPLLPDQQRAAVMLFYFEGLTQKDSAEALGLTLGAFEALLFRARVNLKKQVQLQEATL